MIMPEAIRDTMRDRLWAMAEDLGWSSLSDSERSEFYERWTKDATIGGQLAHFMDPRKVRVYIKDSLLKPYERTRMLETECDVWSALNLAGPDTGAHVYIKPHGRRLEDGRVVCWGKSRDWKLIIMAVFERGQSSVGFSAYAAVLIETGQTAEKSRRQLVRDAAERLGLAHLAWLD